MAGGGDDLPLSDAPGSSCSLISASPLPQRPGEVRTRQNRAMNQLEIARVEWQQAQARVKSALASLERRVADAASAEQVAEAHAALAERQAAADELLQRYITQIGKS